MQKGCNERTFGMKETVKMPTRLDEGGQGGVWCQVKLVISLLSYCWTHSSSA